MRGQLSTTLIRPAELRSILNDISHRLPNSLKLNEFERQKIMWYYKMLPVTVIPDNNKIHIITVIPLIQFGIIIYAIQSSSGFQYLFWAQIEIVKS